MYKKLFSFTYSSKHKEAYMDRKDANEASTSGCSPQNKRRTEQESE